MLTPSGARGAVKEGGRMRERASAQVREFFWRGFRRGVGDATLRAEGGGVRVVWEEGLRVTRQELHMGLY